MSFHLFFHSYTYWFIFLLMLVCSASLLYSSSSCSRSSITPLLPIFYLYSLFFQIISWQITYCYKPATQSSFLLRGNAPDRVALLFSCSRKKVNSYRCRLVQEQECGGTGAKEQYQQCLLVPLQMLGEAHSLSMTSSHPEGALHYINRSPVSFGSHLCWSVPTLSQST